MNKKFALLLVLLAAMVMGSVASASAADVKATGSWTIAAEWMDRTSFSENVETSTFRIRQRMRTGFQFVASENLKAVLDTQIGATNWGSEIFQIGSGRNTSAGAGSANVNGAAIMLRNGYLAFNVPGTKIATTVGFQQVALPAAVGGGSPILDDHMGAAVVSVPVIDKTLTLVGGFARALQDGSTVGQSGSGSAMDAAFLIADYNPMKGVNLKPYAAYAYAGAKSGFSANNGLVTNANASLNSGARAYYGGIAAEVSVFDPIKLMADFHYGKATLGGASTTATESKRSGWMVDFQADYTGLSMMTPSLIFAYSSGEDNNNGTKKDSKRLPVIGAPENFAIGSFFLQGSNTFADGVGGDTSTNMGYWTLGLQLRDIKLIDKLSHTVNVLYFKGTNGANYVAGQSGRADIVYGQFLTTKDSLWEIDLNTKYDIYSELAAYVQLGYINPDFDKTTWASYGASAKGNKDAYRAAFTLNYSF